MTTNVSIRLGTIGAADVVSAFERIGKASEVTQAKITAHGAAARVAATNTGLAQHELINVSRQLQDVAISLQGGQSPMTVLAQQGSQLIDVFVNSQATIGGMARQAGSALLSLLTPARLVTGGLLGIGAAALYAFSEYSASQKELANSLTGLGRGAGATVDQLNRVADAAARVGNISRSGAREAVGIFAATGRIDTGTAGALAGMTRAYGLQTGQDTTAAAKELAGAFADPAKGAELLNEKLGILDARTREYIRSQIAMGERGAAQKAMLEALTPAIAEAEKRVGLLGRAWHATSKAVSDFSDSAGKALNGPTLDERIEELRKALAVAQRPTSIPALNRARQESAAQIDKELGLLELERETNRIRARAAAIEQESMRRSTMATDIIRGAAPEFAERRGLIERRNLLAEVLGDPDTVKRLGESAQVARDALGRLTDQLNAWKDPLTRVQEETRLSVQATLAYTLAERIAAEAERARIRAIEEGKGAVVAAAEAEGARAKAVAEATKQLRDAARDANDAVSLIGLKPYQRAIRELGNEQRRRADTLTDAGGTTGGLDAGFASKLKAFMEAIGGITITSGYRTPERQAELYNEALRKYGSEDEARKRVAPPGRSMHNFGLAADLEFASPAVRAEAQRRAAEFGLQFRVKGEDWHIEPIGAKRGSVPSVGGDGRGLLGEIGAGKRRVIDDQFLAQPLRDANEALDAQIRLQERAAAAYGKSTAEITRAAEEQRLLNEYMRQGVPITEDIATGITAYAKRAGDAAQRVEDINLAQRRYENIVGDLKGAASEVFKGIISDVREGKKGIDVLTGAATRLADRLLSMASDYAINTLFSTLFGKAGGGGQGFGLIGQSLFNLVNPNGYAITGGGALYGPGFASGGIMTSSGPLPLHTYASGGVARSPQMAIFGEGRRPEAYVPLPDGRSIPVTMAGGRAPAVNFTLVNQHPTARVTPRQDPATGDIEVLVDDLESRLARRTADGGPLSKIGRRAA